MNSPAGMRFALAVTVDFDAQSAWLAKGKNDPGILARGEFGAAVGVPRLLEVFKSYGIKTTWGIPGHTLETWPGVCQAVAEAGHETCAHGVYHEHLTDLPAPVERRLMEHQLRQFQEILETRPRGYRAPAFTMSYNTFEILEEFGFDWHSSIPGRDFEPYRPREILEVNPFGATTYGREYDVLEFSSSAYLEDWVAFEYVGGYSMGLSSTEVVLRRWLDSLNFGRLHVTPGVMVLTLHPQCIGRPHHMMMLHRFLEEVSVLDDVWVAPLSEIYDGWMARGTTEEEHSA